MSRLSISQRGPNAVLWHEERLTNSSSPCLDQVRKDNKKVSFHDRSLSFTLYIGDLLQYLRWYWLEIYSSRDIFLFFHLRSHEVLTNNLNYVIMQRIISYWYELISHIIQLVVHIVLSTRAHWTVNLNISRANASALRSTQMNRDEWSLIPSA